LKIKEYFQDYYSSGDLKDLRRLSTQLDNSIINRVSYFNYRFKYKFQA